MPWSVTIKEAVIDHLAWFGKKTGRQLLKRAIEFLERDPLAESKNLKTLRPNSFASRELRLLGKYRYLFVLDEEEKRVTIVLAGEKRGDKLIVCGEEFTEHHESDPTE